MPTSACRRTTSATDSVRVYVTGKGRLKSADGSLLVMRTDTGGVKYAAALAGICEAEVRLPILEPSEGVKAAIRKAMAHAGLLVNA